MLAPLRFILLARWRHTVAEWRRLAKFVTGKVTGEFADQVAGGGDLNGKIRSREIL
ncbi:MAG: hypothetical protein U1A24_16325 [Cypionkella sp.]|uniref:hypothetical protein n=1 Tax=Cypionkella sp. TaxID=2811411 RepID=UPI002AB91213|nr:hypothetical protein [Cypionkella sp.]MDZ4312115.1 hypothetical protein [Cypionkella sp.]